MANTLRAVLVGCGGMGNNWARVLSTRTDLEIVGLVDIESSATASLARRVGLEVPQLQSLEESIKVLQPDVVLDTSVPESRRYIAGTALTKGCHVLSEKPLAASVGEARELVELAEATGKTHAVMQNRRYLAGSQQVRQLIDDGTIGELGLICADFFIGAHFGGFREEMDNVLLLDMAIHTFDQARFMTGLDCESAYCHEFNTPESWYRGNASALCIFDMEGGVPFCYRGSWTAEGASTPWESQWRIVGSRGTVIWNGTDEPWAEVVEPSDAFVRQTRRVSSSLEWKGPAGHAGCLDDMIKALQTGVQPMTSSADNVKSLAMVFAAVASAERGARCEVEL